MNAAVATDTQTYGQAMSERTAKARKPLWDANCKQNMEDRLILPLSDALATLRQYISGQAIVIVCAGDSINEPKNIKALRRCNKEGINIMAADVVSPYLTELGIETICLVNYDAEDMSWYVENGHKTVIGTQVSHPNTFKAADYSFAINIVDGGHIIPQNILLGDQMFQVTTCVAAFMLQLAAYFGAKHIYPIGNDFSFKHFYHFRGSRIYNGYLSTQSRFDTLEGYAQTEREENRAFYLKGSKYPYTTNKLLQYELGSFRRTKELLMNHIPGLEVH